MLSDKFKDRFPVVFDSLKNARTSGRIAHAYLLHSDHPETRRQFALLVAQIATCPNSANDGMPCGICDSCRQLENETYAELYILEPISKSRMIQVGDNANPEPDTIRWFENQFYFTSVTDMGTKVGIIHDCDRMNAEGQNSFLKTLEEPPHNTFFILTTGNPASLLPTTRSRCQSLVLLENSCTYEFNGCAELFAALKSLQLSGGTLGEAEKYVDEVLAIAKGLEGHAIATIEEDWQKQIEDSKELESPARKRIEKRFEAAKRAEYLRIRSYFLSALHTWFAQVYQLCCGTPHDQLANPEITSAYKNELASLDEAIAFNALQQAEKLLQDLRWNVSEELAIRSFCYSISVK